MYITCTLAVYLPRSLCTVMIIHKESRSRKKSKSLDFKLAHQQFSVKVDYGGFFLMGIYLLIKNFTEKNENVNCKHYMLLCKTRGGSRMVGALRQTTWWGPLRRSA